MTICLADLPLICMFSCCFRVEYTCSPSSCSFFSMAIWPAFSCTSPMAPMGPAGAGGATGADSCRGAWSTVGGGMLASLGGLLSLLLLPLLLLRLPLLLLPRESRSRLLRMGERRGLGLLSPGGLLGPIWTPWPGNILMGRPISSRGNPHFRIGLSLQSAVGLTAVVRLGSTPGRDTWATAGTATGFISFIASTPMLVATASIAWIFAVTAAAATAEALGMAWGTPAAPMFLSPGGVTARPTLSSCPPRSNRFIELIASWQDWRVSYSIYPYPLCRPGIPALARSQVLMGPKAEKTERISSSCRSLCMPATYILL